jgi:hypothetical protein
MISRGVAQPDLVKGSRERKKVRAAKYQVSICVISAITVSFHSSNLYFTATFAILDVCATSSIA